MLDPGSKRWRTRQRSVFDFACFGVAIVALAFASSALTEPWASGRALILFKITRGPGIALVIATGLAAVAGAVQAIASPRTGRVIMGAVHTALGTMICAVAGIAFASIRAAKAGFLVGTVATIHVGPGLRLWLAAGAILLALGAAEVAFASLVEARGRRRSRRNPPLPGEVA